MDPDASRVEAVKGYLRRGTPELRRANLALFVAGPALYLLCYYLGSSIGGSAGGLAYSYAGWPGLVAMVAGLLILALISAVQLTLSSRAAEKDAG